MPINVNNDDIEARLGDLDLKSPDGDKMQYWRDTEMSLITEGWYAGQGSLQDEICLLSKSLGAN